MRLSMSVVFCFFPLSRICDLSRDSSSLARASATSALLFSFVILRTGASEAKICRHRSVSAPNP
jgi:hypothetical protein